MAELETTALALCLVALVVGLGLSACYCQNPDAPGGGSGRQSGGPSKCPAWRRPSFGSSSSGGPPRGTFASKRSRVGANEARAIELARFARMGERSDAYPKPPTAGTRSPTSNPLGAWSPASSSAASVSSFVLRKLKGEDAAALL